MVIETLLASSVGAAKSRFPTHRFHQTDPENIKQAVWSLTVVETLSGGPQKVVGLELPAALLALGPLPDVEVIIGVPIDSATPNSMNLVPLMQRTE